MTMRHYYVPLHPREYDINDMLWGATSTYMNAIDSSGNEQIALWSIGTRVGRGML